MRRLFSAVVARRHVVVPASKPDDDLDLGSVAPFSLKERSGETITNDTLRGKVWIASFIFTALLRRPLPAGHRHRGSPAIGIEGQG